MNCMNDLIKKIDQIIEDKSLLKHPFYEMWSDGKLEFKSLIGYSWYHIPEDRKEPVLKNYLQQLGFSFTSEQVKEVLKRKAPSRKTGSRPQKINLRKRKSIN